MQPLEFEPDPLSVTMDPSWKLLVVLLGLAFGLALAVAFVVARSRGAVRSPSPLGIAGVVIGVVVAVWFLNRSRVAHEQQLIHEKQQWVQAQIQDSAEIDAAFTQLTEPRVVLEENAKEKVEELSEVDTQEASPPDWVESPPKKDGNVFRIATATQLCLTQSQCNQQQRTQLAETAIEYLRDNLDPSMHRPSTSLRAGDLGANSAELRRRLLLAEHWEQTPHHTGSGGGCSYKLHSLIQIDQHNGTWLISAWQDRVRDESVAAVAMGFIGVLACLGVTFGALKYDESTGGRYGKRLFAAVPLAIIGGLILLALTSEWWDGFLL